MKKYIGNKYLRRRVITVVLAIVALIAIINVIFPQDDILDISDPKTEDKLRETTKVIILDHEKNFESTISNTKEITALVNLLLTAKEETEEVSKEDNNKTLYFFDSKDKISFKIKSWKDGHFGLKGKEYRIITRLQDSYFRIIGW